MKGNGSTRGWHHPKSCKIPKAHGSHGMPPENHMWESECWPALSRVNLAYILFNSHIKTEIIPHKPVQWWALLLAVNKTSNTCSHPTMKTGGEVLCFDCRTNHPFLMKQEYCQLSSVSKTNATRTSTLSNLISQGFILCNAVLYFSVPFVQWILWCLCWPWKIRHKICSW